ncbi:MAG: Uncharacterized protein Greene041619_1216 [Candidatus Peregrinibacteria bacterium Greene0416_19]|nr:MAG: Uncharacterized protein Greene041619_1216 [Candidatus Peregrinibacteria bacterium Greene0416_19]
MAPLTAHADYRLFNTVVNVVGGGLPSLPVGSGGTAAFVGLAQLFVVRFRTLILWIAFLMIVIAGIRMIVGQEDDAVDKAKAIISACVSGVILSYLVEPFVVGFYGARGEAVRGGNVVVENEIVGLINWALVIIAPIAVAMIIVSAAKAFLKAGSDEGVTEMRKTIVNVLIGMIILAARMAIVYAVGGTLRPHPNWIIGIVVGIMGVVLGFMALVAATVVIYAGIRMVLSFGKEDEFTKAKSLIIRAVVGLIVILVSLSLVQFVFGAAFA